MLKNVVIAILVLLCLHSQGVAQSNIYNPAIDVFQRTPATPTSAGLGKYFEFPVNMSTGLPSIQVPLFTIKTGNITLPISLSYHAGGVKVDELPGNVGMNWSLQAGGMVNRRVNGLDDFYGGSSTVSTGTYISPSYSTYTTAFNNIPDLVDGFGTLPPNDVQKFLGRIADGIVDGEADEYFFSTPAGSGKIAYNQRSQEYQVSTRNGWSAVLDQLVQPMGRWGVGASDGTYYEFGMVETIKNPLLSRPSMAPGGILNQTYLPSAWYLTYIKDGVHNKEIQYYYTSTWKYYEMGYNMWQNFLLNGTYAGESIARTDREGDEISLSSISFDEGIVKFFYDSSPRLDGGPPVIKEIRMERQDGSLVKKYLLNYLLDTARSTSNVPDVTAQYLFLKSVQEISVNGTDTLRKAPYEFVYNFNKHIPKRYSFAQDTWGYFNGKLSNTTLIPDAILQAYNTTLAGTGADRSVDTVYSQAGSLKEFRYPTGGKAIFDFENNYANDELTGGLRIRKLRQYDPVTQTELTTEYSYTHAYNGQSSGYRLFNPQYYYQWMHIPSGGVNSQMHLKVEGQSIYPLFSYQSSPVIYREVAKKEKGSTSDLLSRHYFTMPTELNNGSGEGSGVPHNKFVIDDNSGGMEYATETYRKNADNSYTLIKKDSLIIGTLNGYNDYFWNVQAAWMGHLTSTWATWEGNDPYTQIPTMNMSVGTNLYKFFRESSVVKEKYTISYDGVSTLREKTLMNYDISNGNNTVTKIIASNGDTLISIKKYKTDYNYYSGSPSSWNYEVALLFPSQPVEIINYSKSPGSTDSLLIDATLIEYQSNAIKRIYKLFQTDAITDFHPSYNASANFYYDSRYTLFQEVSSVDYRKNPTTVSQYGKQVSYVWDHSATMITAQVENAASAEIAYTSFETDSTGNWTISGGSKNTGYFLTGASAYNLTSGVSITKASLPNKDYTVSYWSRNGSLSVNGSTGVASVSKNGWTLYKHQLSAVTSVSISGIAIIDELRLHPKAAMMSTTTYDPLIGITSRCDVKQGVVYYEYDRLGRLTLIRDQDKNILKRICYNYAGQPEECPIDAAATWRSTGVTRCQPCPSNNTYINNIQEHQELDMNPNSSTYNTLRWVSDGVSGSCVPVANWQNTATALRCKTVGGVNTGEREREQVDMNPCSPTGGQTRWVVVDQNCSVCPKSANWQVTSTYRCVTSGGNNTGEQERQEIDVETCSATYNQTRWVSVGTNCTACAKPANWQTTGNYRCVTSGGINTGEQEREEKDTETCSATYNQIRWVSVGTNCTACAKPANWQVTGNYRCVTSGGANTGEQEREEKNMEPCSPTYNQTRWVSVGTNLTACPIPCGPSNCSGDDKKCINGVCTTGTLVCVSSVRVRTTWTCTWKYCFSDGSLSTYSTTTTSATDCLVLICGN